MIYLTPFYKCLTKNVLIFCIELFHVAQCVIGLSNEVPIFVCNHLTPYFSSLNNLKQETVNLISGFLNFQTQSVPRVVVMGSSTASETTINTSTDSSNTIVTTMTATDGDNTEDSLDMNEQHDILNTDNFADNKLSSQILQPVPVTPKTPATARQQTPPTAKEERKFVFDVVQTPPVKKEGVFTFENKKTEKVQDKLETEDVKFEARRRNSYKVRI